MKKSMLSLALIGLLGLPASIVTAQTYSVANEQAIHLGSDQATLEYDSDIARMALHSVANERAIHLGSDQATLVFDRDTASMALPLGASRYQVVQIPQGQYQVNIRADIYKSVFAPTVYVIDAQGQILQTYSQQQLSLKPATAMSPDQLQLTFVVDSQQGAQALIIATSAAQLLATTEIEHPARQLAKARSNQPPNIPNLFIQHVATGEVQIRLSKMETHTQPAAPILVTSTATARDAAQNHQVSLSAEPTAAKPLLAESEAMYNQAINKAVANKDHELALKLMLEATEHGSTSARATYLEALQNL
ncbi:hypothetical protein K6Y31_15105 [Motilimonas cestriensis]|uniref:Uncharacterized protein n=1 Tax=Motilimonas cestriensis TaxID=2742685 RepID=A0ABS8WCB6_9GAMM|nr:MalM family protein [Motilimonas cestriensis]MCE2596140.1 hypothetical protein [Motilimonas cestriensis]